jgi:hypothetical protein
MEINIALDFSRIPGARYPEEGDFSGQEFRQTILLPKLQEAIKKQEKLTVNLDGTAGLGTSFLEESFGGLIRVDKFDVDSLENTLNFISEEDPDYITEIWSYINEAYEQESK